MSRVMPACSRVVVRREGVRLIASAAALLAIAVWAGPVRAQIGDTLPFSQEEDADGSFWVWLAFDQGAGLPYERVPAREIGHSPSFRRISSAEREPGDVAAWPDLMALVDDDAKLVLVGRKLALSEVEKKRGPATWYRWQERAKTPEKLSRVKFSASFQAENPDSYVWLPGKEAANDSRFILQLDRRPIRMMNGKDGFAGLSLVGEVVPAGTTARQHAEEVVKRESLPRPRITEANGLVRMEGDCAEGHCRLIRTVRVRGVTAITAVCALPAPLEARLKQDCEAWLRSASIDTFSEPGGHFFRSSGGPPQVPDEAGALDLKGLEALKQGRWEDAVAAYDEAIGLAPGVGSYRFNRGTALLQVGRVDAAAADFAKAVELKPELNDVAGKPWARALLARGMKAVDRGDLDGALADFWEAQNRDPSQPQPWAEEAYVHAQRQEGDACVRAATEALKRDPSCFEALGTRAYCLVKMRRAGEALQDLDRALKIRPNGQLYAARAEAKAQLGDRAGARQDADAAVRQDPDLRGPLTVILEAQ